MLDPDPTIVTTTIAANDMPALGGTWAITPETLTVSEGNDASYTVQYILGSAAEQGSTVSILVTVVLPVAQTAEDRPAQANDFDGDPDTEGRQPLTSAALADIIRNDEFRMRGGTATADLNVIRRARVDLIIEPPVRETSFSIDLPIFDDTDFEGDETFRVTLAIPSNPTMTLATAETTIAASDRPASAGLWRIRTTTLTVVETTTPTGVADNNARYIVQYTSIDPEQRREQGSPVSITVTVGFPPGQADANDFDVDPSDPGIQPLTSAALASAINNAPVIAGGSLTATAITTGTDISARVTLNTDENVIARFSVVLPIANDQDPEDDEAFTVRIEDSNPRGIQRRLATTVIAVNDLTWAISPETLNVAEGDDARYTVQYRGLAGDTPSIIVTVNLSDPAISNPAMANDFDFDRSTPGIEPLTSVALASAINNATVTEGGSGISNN